METRHATPKIAEMARLQSGDACDEDDDDEDDATHNATERCK